MSDDEREIDVESDEEGKGRHGFVDKRAHHNALERKRRDHIKEGFTGLRDAIPTMQGDKSSRAQILKKASEYICTMRKKNGSHTKDIEDLKKQNNHLEAQIRALEKAKNSGVYSSASQVLDSVGLNYDAGAVSESNTVAVVNANADPASYEGSSGSDTSEGQQQQQHIQQHNGTSLIRTIQPGRSLLITPATTVIHTTTTSTNGEPVTKRMRT